MAGCFYVPRLSTLTARFDQQVERAKSAQNLETAQPAQAEKVYRDILENVVIYKSLGDYQKQFGTELSQIQGGGTADFNQDSVMALPHVYDKAVEAAALSRLGLARLAWARGDLATAEKEASRVLELAGKRALSPLLEAHLQLTSYEILRQVYAKQNKTGREKLAALNGDLVKDYLASPAAAKDEEDARRQLDADLANMKMVDDFTATVNSQRTQKALDAMSQFAGAMSQAVGTMQQYQMNAALAQSHGRVTPEIARMQTNQRNLAFQQQLLSLNPAFARGVAFSANVLSPFNSLTVSQQLINPQFGAKAPDLIKEFAGALAKISGNESVQKSADLVKSSVDAVVSVRGGKPVEIAKALNKFSDSFDAFQAQTQGVAEKPAQ
jgi:hypothetical protein